MTAPNATLEYRFDPKRLIEEWDKSVDPSRHRNPWPVGLEDLLLVVFEASLNTEEGVPVRPYCVITDAGEKLPFSSELREPIAATSAAVSKLAQVTEHARRALHIEWRDRLVAVGLVEVERGAGEHDQLWNGNLVQVEASSAANISLSVGAPSPAPYAAPHLARFRRGRYLARSVERQTVWVRDLYRAGAKQYVDALLDSVPGCVPTASGAARLPDLAIPKHEFRGCATEIAAWIQGAIIRTIERIQRQGRGGSLLCLSRSDDVARVPVMSKSDTMFVVQPELPGRYPWRGIIDRLTWSAAYGHCRRPHMVDPALLNVRAAQKTAERYLQDASYWLNEYTKHLAALMLPDGTVVTGEWLNPVAIGAKLKVESSDRIRPEFSAFLESAGKGMRHRSVASAITAVPDAFGVVVSSDGPVTIFRGASIPGDAVMEAIM